MAGLFQSVGRKQSMQILEHDLADLRYAKHLLEHPGIAAKVSNLLGKSIEKGLELLPENAYDTILNITKESLQKALNFTIKTIDDRFTYPSSVRNTTRNSVFNSRKSSQADRNPSSLWMTSRNSPAWGGHCWKNWATG